jgi:hypothetical protein
MLIIHNYFDHNYAYLRQQRKETVVMRSKQIMDSLVELHGELETSENVDPQVLEEVRELDSKMHEMLKSNELNAEENLTERLLQLETQFAAEHPVLERITRELIDRLSQMGV